jgi:predicted ABC-type ATPase
MSRASNQPKLVVFAGPNGSGKSTITTEFRLEPEFPNNYINPDEIALTLIEETSPKKVYQAAIIAERRRQEFIKLRQSFSFETVMSHPSKLKVLQQAKDAGYQVEIVFIATSDPAVNIDRVRQRVAEGGHDVPPDKIVARYYRVIELLPAAAEIVDRVRMYDNTNLPRLIATIENGRVSYLTTDDTPQWIQNVIRQLNQRESDRNNLFVEATRTRFSLSIADLDRGKYIGTVSSITDSYIAQQIDRNTLVLHDRSVVKEPLSVDRDVRIAYRDGNVRANYNPTPEARQWAERVFPNLEAIIQAARNSEQVVTSSRGIEVIESELYQLELNNNNRTLRIIHVQSLREVTVYDLEEKTVIAAQPTAEDLAYWRVEQ